MKRTVGYVLFGVALYVVFAIATFPAARAYVLLEDKLADVTLYDVSGTVWNGKAKAADVQNQHLRSVNWSLRPWTVPLGRLDVKWSFDNGNMWGSGIAGLTAGGNLRLAGLEAAVPATELQPLLRRVPARLGGTFVVDLENAKVDMAANVPLAAQGQLRWKNAAITVVEEAGLGQFQMDFETTDEGVQGTLTDGGDGPLEAEGLLLVQPDGQYRFTGTVAVRDTSRRDLIQGLRFLGRPGPDGRIPLSYSGTL